MIKKKYLVLLGVTLLSFGVLLGFDVWTKAWAVASIDAPIKLLGNWFALIPFQKNTGIAFSIQLPHWFQTGGSALILLGLFGFGMKHVWSMERFKILSAVLLGMVLGGGVGNLIERIGQGYVVDFIKLGPIPIFNIADIGVVLGLLGLFATMQLVSNTK